MHSYYTIQFVFSSVSSYMYSLSFVKGNISFLNLVCSKTHFPLNGRVVDIHTQTPLHLALRAKYNDKSTQVRGE